MKGCHEKQDLFSGWRATLENACERNHTEVGNFKQDRSRRRSEEILAAAVRVFARDGIARAASPISRPRPACRCRRFTITTRARKNFAYAVPMRRQTEFFAEFRKDAAKMETTREKLGHFLWLTTDFARRHPDWARVLYLEVWPSVWIKDSDIRDVLDDYGRIIVGMIREGAERGEWPAVPDPYPLTTIFIGAINQVITVWLLYRRPRNLATGSRQMVDQMMELLTQRKSAGASLARPAKTAKTSAAKTSCTTARGKSAVG